MRESAEYFLAGFYGLNWELNPQIKLEFILEVNGYNNSLIGSYACNDSSLNASATGTVAQTQWYQNYLQNATARFQSMSSDFNWTADTVYAMQGLCPYETVALGYSSFCSLFNFQEWQSYEYAIDISFQGNNMFQSPTGRAIGVGYVQELLAVITSTWTRSQEAHG